MLFLVMAPFGPLYFLEKHPRCRLPDVNLNAENNEYPVLRARTGFVRLE
jgi:hypothetical protein